MDVVRRLARGSALARDVVVAAAGLAAILLWAFLVSVAPFPLWHASVAVLLAVIAAALALLAYILVVDAVFCAVRRRVARRDDAVAALPALYWGTPI